MHLYEFLVISSVTVLM